MALLASRRSLVLSAAAAAMAFGLDGTLTVAEARHCRHRSHRHAPGRHVSDQHAPHQRTPDPAQGYDRTKVGDAEITAIYDGVL